ncbi:phytanoyl-CoA dioxygenase family protein [Actinosynnema sp. NPDC023658]|uniref:phytanoyl-CoA dioxygenase family protein n=1 Tax=Actinosynnema sp. NPDC023658 TaxID=3155465 RepID=UPI0033C3029A
MPAFVKDPAVGVSPHWQRDLHDVRPAEPLPAADPALRPRYAEHGFVTCSGLLSADEVAELDRNVERYRRHIAPRLPRADWVNRGPDGVIRNMYFLERVDPFFAAYGERAGLLDLVALVTGREPRYLGAETFDKPARTGTPSLPHQDGIYFEGRTTRLVHIWIPLDTADATNGALLYWPGSHTQGLLEHRPIDGDPYLGAIPDETVAALGRPALAAVHPGDAVLHHDRVVHASNPNRSPAGRRAVALGYTVT